MNKEDLIREVSALLQIRLHRQLYQSKGSKIIDAIFDVIAEALQREEKVVIPGFGTFMVTEYPARWRGSYVFNGPAKGHVDHRHCAAYKRVVFRPCVGLKKFISEGVEDESRS